MIQIHQDAVPLRVWEDGSIRIGESRIRLWLVIAAWESGATPEYICKQLYPTLGLGDAYTAIAYFLRHKEELTEYFRTQETEADRAWQAYTNTPEYNESREKLLAFKAERERCHEEAHQ